MRTLVENLRAEAGEVMPTDTTYDWSQFTMKIEIGAHIDKVFRAWTDEKVIVKWFCVKANIVPERGGRIYFEWLAGDKMDKQIIDIRKPRLLLIPFGEKKEKVEVSLIKVKAGTLLTLRQFDMKTDNKSKVTMHLGCRNGWTFFLTNLKSYLEYGKDLRSHDPNKSYKQQYVNS